MVDGWVRWPEETAEAYRRAGYWRGVTLGDLLADWAGRYGQRVAVVDGDDHLTYADLDAGATELACGLARLGIERDDRVIVQLPNTAAFLTLTFALFRLGALPVMALPPHREHEVGYLAEFSDAAAYAIPGEWRGFDHRELARSVRARAPGLRHVLVSGADAQEFTALDSLARDGDLAPGPAPSEVALFLLSGGTTGLPKLIPRTHDDYAYNLTRSAEVSGLSAETVYLVCLPISHNFPFGCPGVLGTLSVGGRVVMAPGPESETAFGLIERERVTTTALVPAAAIRWLDTPRERYDLSSLSLLQVGGARFAPEKARRVAGELGATLQQVFGMAEGLLNYTRLDDPEDVIVQTQGRPMSEGDEIRVVDAAGDPVPDGEPGALETRGPYTLRGYWRAEQHNARAFSPDGFYRTGDIVRVRPDGNLVVEGRDKDLINRGGEKISAEEVENLVLSHPAVANVAVVAMPDEVLGERSCACVVLQPGTALDLAGLVAHLRERNVATFKLPERLEVLEALPLTNVGKIDKAALRADVAAKLERELV